MRSDARSRRAVRAPRAPRGRRLDASRGRKRMRTPRLGRGSVRQRSHTPRASHVRARRSPDPCSMSSSGSPRPRAPTSPARPARRFASSWMPSTARATTPRIPGSDGGRGSRSRTRVRTAAVISPCSPTPASTIRIGSRSASGTRPLGGHPFGRAGRPAPWKVGTLDLYVHGTRTVEEQTRDAERRRAVHRPMARSRRPVAR